MVEPFIPIFTSWSSEEGIIRGGHTILSGTCSNFRSLSRTLFRRIFLLSVFRFVCVTLANSDFLLVPSFRRSGSTDTHSHQARAMKIADSTQFFPFLCLLSLSLHFQEGTTFFVFLRGQSSSCGAISLSGTRITASCGHTCQSETFPLGKVGQFAREGTSSKLLLFFFFWPVWPGSSSSSTFFFTRTHTQTHPTHFCLGENWPRSGLPLKMATSRGVHSHSSTGGKSGFFTHDTPSCCSLVVVCAEKRNFSFLHSDEHAHKRDETFCASFPLLFYSSLIKLAQR